jgi:NNP family nitrate/nitrite transporter-like MFS transporter
METRATTQSHKALALSTIAFSVCFAAWMLNGVLVTFLVSNQLFNWSAVEVGWLMGIPALTGSVLRLPAGMLTDRYGGKPIYVGVLLLCAVPMYFLGHTHSFWSFALCSLGFGTVGVSFAVGIAYTSVWYPKENQGTALGVFGAGNAGAALTTFLGPALLNKLTAGGTDLEGWRTLPKLYAAMLVVMGVAFALLARNKRPEGQVVRGWGETLTPLRELRVWRFGLYYFIVFGCFVAFAQWLVPYLVNVYQLGLAAAGVVAGCFSLPSGLIRAVGGWMSDKWGARRMMYWILGSSTVICLALTIPRMEVHSVGPGVLAKMPGVVQSVEPGRVVVGKTAYDVTRPPSTRVDLSRGVMVFPAAETWQEPVVRVGDRVAKNQLLARGVTHIAFQANVWIFSVLVIIVGIIWGIGKAAVYKHVPTYFPKQVGVVGGMVGVIGGLGGFFCPILFGYLLGKTGLWSSCWAFLFVLSLVALWWMHIVIKRLMLRAAPKVASHFEDAGLHLPETATLILREVTCPGKGTKAVVTLVESPDGAPPRPIRCVLVEPAGLQCGGSCITDLAPSTDDDSAEVSASTETRSRTDG